MFTRPGTVVFHDPPVPHPSLAFPFFQRRTILVVDEPPMGSDVYPDKPEDGAGVQNQTVIWWEMVIYLGKL